MNGMLYRVRDILIFRDGTSLCNSAESVLVSGSRSDLSLCHLHGSDSGQPFLCGSVSSL